MSRQKGTEADAAKRDYLKECIRQYVRDGLPVRTDTVMRLAALDPDSEVSLEELSAIILEDIGLTAKVIQTVNSFYYRRLGHEVSSVTQAVVLLGFNTIREIALGMALIDLAEKKGDDTLVSLIFSSYFGAHLAQEILGDNHHPRQGDAVLVAGLFHAIARIILALDSDEAYSELEELEKSNATETRRVLRELGELIAMHWKLPPFITENLEGLSSGEKKVGSVITGAHILGRGLAFQGAGQETISQAIRRLSSKTGLREEDINEKVGIAINKSVGLSPHFRRFVEGESDIRRLIGLEKVQSIPLQRAHRDKTQDSDHRFMALFTQLSSAITARRLTVDQAFLLATETIYRGMEVDWVILMLLTKDRKALIPRYGLGPEAKVYREGIKIAFPPKDRAMKAAFDEDREVIVSIATLCTGSHAGGHHGDHGTSGVCALSPIIVESRPIGCFIVNKCRDSIGEVDLLRLKAVKDLVVMATLKR